MKHPQSSRTSFRYANPLKGAAPVAGQSPLHGARWRGLLRGLWIVWHADVACNAVDTLQSPFSFS